MRERVRAFYRIRYKHYIYDILIELFLISNLYHIDNICLYYSWKHLLLLRHKEASKAASI